MPPKGPKPQQQSQPPQQQQQQQQHVDPLAPSTTHFSAASGQSVVAFLSKVTGAKPATSGTAPPTSGGALEYLNQQNKAKKANAASKQQQQQQVPPPPQEAAPAAAPAKGGKPQQAQVQQQPAPQVPHPKKGGKAPIHVVPEPQQQQPSKPQEPSARPKPRSAVEAVTGGKPQQPKKQHQQQQQGNAAAQNANVAPAAAAEPAAPVDPAQLELEAAKRLTYETFVNALYKQEARPDSTPLLDIPALLEVIRDHQVTMVCTDTGTGKSSALPNALLDANPANRIVSSQPRRTATMSIAGHVAGMRGERIGDSVGYWIRGAKAGDDNTRLWYLTSYTLLLQLLGHPEVPYTHIILDEFHERQPDLEVTMALLRLALRRGANFKLILVSATLNFDDWAKYLEGLDVALFQQSEVEHRVWDFGSEQFCPLLGMAVPMPSQLSFADNGYVDNAIFVAQYLISFINSHCAPHHAALIFLPGRAQVEMFTMWIETAAANRITPIPWHSAVELSTIQAAIRKPAGTKQKLYIATDIAEVSITIPDLVFVIDLGLVKRPQINVQLEASIMFPPLSTQFVSQSSLSQRRGRVGRTQQGFYFSILPTEIVRQLPEHNVAPIQNSRIDELALHVLQVVENPIALFSLCCGQPAIESVLTSMRTLTDAGCIVPERKKEEDDEEVAPRSAWNQPIMADAGAAVDEGVSIERYSATFVGKLAQVLPVSVSQAMLVFYGFLTGLESLMILSAACANLPIPYVVAAPTNQFGGGGRGGGGRGGRGRGGGDSIGRAMEHTELSMKEHGGESKSDIIAAMGVTLAFRLEVATGATDQQLNTWCQRQSVSRERIQAIVDLEEHIKFELGTFMPFRDVDDPNVLLQQMGRLRPVVSAMICTAFAAQALEVTAEGSMQFKVKEGASGIFTNLSAMPDLHTPSCIRWNVGEVVIPVTLSLRYSHLLGSYTTCVDGLKSFYISCVLFAHSLNYEIFEDENGQYYEFLLTFHGRSRVLEANKDTGSAIIMFRSQLQTICQQLSQIRTQQAERNATTAGGATSDEAQQAQVLAMSDLQRKVVAALQGFFFGAGFEKLELNEIQPGDETIDRRSTLTF